MRVLLPIEDPLFASELVDFVARHKWPQNTEFHVVHVIEPFLLDVSQAAFSKLLSQPEQEIRGHAVCMVEEVASEIKRRSNAFNATSEVRTGRVLPELLGAIRQHQSDLVIAGSHGKSGFNRLVIGSVSLALATDAPCPVLLVKPESSVLKNWEKISPNSVYNLSISEMLSNRKSLSKESRILVCVDEKRSTNRLVSFMLKHKWAEAARFKVLSVIPPLRWAGLVPLPDLELLREQLLKSKRDLVSVVALKLSENSPDSVVLEEVIESDPKQAIIKVAADWQAELIVLGASRRDPNEKQALGSVALYILSAAPCSVLVMRDSPVPAWRRDESATAAGLR